jgi:hypothetical protein
MQHDELVDVFNAVLLDNPLIFHVTSYNYVICSVGRKCSFKPIYRYSQNVHERYSRKISGFLSVFDCVMHKTDEDKELFVHDFCLENFTYDYSFGEFSYSALGCILKKSAVCEGIAKFVKLALDYLGVKCIVVIGDGINPTSGATDLHAWNIVKLGDSSFHLDVTFNLCLSEKIKRYDYFNLSDRDIKRDHVIKNIVPVCSTTGRDYYSANKLTVNSSDEMKKFIAENLRKGKNRTVFKLTNVQNTDDLDEKILKIAIEQYAKIANNNAQIELSTNMKQYIFELGFAII